MFDFMQVIERDGYMVDLGDGYMVDLGDPDNEVAWCAALDTWMEGGNLAGERAYDVECDLVKEIAGRAGYECDNDAGSSKGDGSGGGAAAEPTWPELWADVDRSVPDECGGEEAATGLDRQVGKNGVQGDDVATAEGVVDAAENLGSAPCAAGEESWADVAQADGSTGSGVDSAFCGECLVSDLQAAGGGVAGEDAGDGTSYFQGQSSRPVQTSWCL